MTVTGNVESFIRRVGMDSIELSPTNPEVEINEDYIIVVPTYEGELNDDISEFIEYKNNFKHLVGFAGSGNINFGDDLYCINARELSYIYDTPVIFKFEFEGTEKDIANFKKEVEKVEVARIKQKG